MIEGLRSLVVEGWDSDKLAATFGGTVTLGVVLTGLSSWAAATDDR